MSSLKAKHDRWYSTVDREVARKKFLEDVLDKFFESNDATREIKIDIDKYGILRSEYFTSVIAPVYFKTVDKDKILEEFNNTMKVLIVDHGLIHVEYHFFFVAQTSDLFYILLRLTLK